MTGVVVLVVVVILATAFGLYRRRVDGRLRPVGPQPDPYVAIPALTEIEAADEGSIPIAGAPSGPELAHHQDRLTAAEIGGELGLKATLVQFSSAFCAPCRSTRLVLDEVSAMIPGVAHIEIDAEAHLDLVRRLDVRRTPTVFVLDGEGVVRVRAAGAPRKADVIAALGTLI